MTKREAARRNEQRRTSLAANRAEPVPSASVVGPPPGKALLSRDDLRALGVPWSRSRLYKVIAAGRFPRPVATGPNVYDRKLWRRQDVERWLRQLRPVAEPAE
jgi:predicted DNA-binding transcriptional regulator AlpA